MGLLVSGAAALIAGILLGERSIYFPMTALFCAVTGVLIVLFWKWKGRSASGRSVAERFILAGLLLWGFFHLQWAVRIPPNDLAHFASGEKMTVLGQVIEPPKFYPGKTILLLEARGVVESGSAGSAGSERERPVSGGIRLSIYEPEVPVDYGDLIRFTARIKPIRSFENPGGFDYARYMAWRGVRTSAGVSRGEGLIKIGEEGNPILKRIFDWREEIRRAMDRSLSSEASAVLQAMVVGTTGGLTPEIRDDFMAAGVTHILSISGSHLGMLAFLIFTGTRFLILRLPAGLLLRLGTRILPSKIAALVTIPPVTFYALLAGGETATLRSLIMVSIYLMAVLLEREGEIPASLAVAALLVLLYDPRALFDISFQLSYAAVLAMAWVSTSRPEEVEEPGIIRGSRIAKWLRERAIQGVRIYLVLSVAVFAATAPLVAYYFNTVSWVGFLANGLVVPLVGNIVVPLGLLSGVLLLIGPGGDLPLAGWNEGVTAFLLRVVEGFAGLPGAELHVPSPSLFGLAAIYGGLGTFILWRIYRGRSTLAIGGVALFLILGIGAVPARGFPDLDYPVQITFLDVGQGDAAVLRLGEKVMVIDGGGTFGDTFDLGRSVVAPYLWDQGIDRIDVMAATHPQLDHMEGLVYLLDRFRVGEVWVNGDSSRADFAIRFDQQVQEKKIPRYEPTSGWPERDVGPCRVAFLNPPGPGAPGEGRGKVNDRSLVLRIRCNEVSLLLTGDIERRGIRNLLAGGEVLESTVLKVPHHGSRGSVDPDFVSKVCPQAAVISAGFLNAYHHPSSEALEAYRGVGARVYRTDEDGALLLKSDGRSILLEAARESVLRPVSRQTFRGIWTEELRNYHRLRVGFRG